MTNTSVMAGTTWKSSGIVQQLNLYSRVRAENKEQKIYVP
jgi:hypothetical protein